MESPFILIVLYRIRGNHDTRRLSPIRRLFFVHDGFHRILYSDVRACVRQYRIFVILSTPSSYRNHGPVLWRHQCGRVAIRHPAHIRDWTPCRNGRDSPSLSRILDCLLPRWLLHHICHSRSLETGVFHIQSN